MTAAGPRRPDPWLIRLRSVLGGGAFIWEVGFDQHQRWWVIVIALWLLGAPLEELTRLFTAGRIAITVGKRKDGEDEDP